MTALEALADTGAECPGIDIRFRERFGEVISSETITELFRRKPTNDDSLFGSPVR